MAPSVSQPWKIETDKINPTLWASTSGNPLRPWSSHVLNCTVARINYLHPDYNYNKSWSPQHMPDPSPKPKLPQWTSPKILANCFLITVDIIVESLRLYIPDFSAPWVSLKSTHPFVLVWNHGGLDQLNIREFKQSLIACSCFIELFRKFNVLPVRLNVCSGFY